MCVGLACEHACLSVSASLLSVLHHLSVGGLMSWVVNELKPAMCVCVSVSEALLQSTATCKALLDHKLQVAQELPTTVRRKWVHSGARWLC